MGRRHRRLRRQIPKQPHVGSHEMLATENNEEKNAADQLAEQSGQTFCSSSDLDTSHSHNFIDKPIFHGFHCDIPVFLPSTNRQLLASLLALDRGDSVVISGPVGCGKSAFINHLRSIVCTRLIRLQISEQTDAKNLLGAYCCSELPGQFVWRPGPLLTALTEGSWLVLEDIDKGSAELQVLLTSVLGHNNLSLPCLKNSLVNPISGEPIVPHRDFRLLMTRRLVAGPTGNWRLEFDNPLMELVDRQSYVIHLPALTVDCLRILASQLYPDIGLLLDRIMNIYNHVCSPHVPNTASPDLRRGRYISSRDLLKFCSRISSLPEEDRQAEPMLLHAADCFLAPMIDSDAMTKLASRVASELNLSSEKVNYILRRRPIELKVNLDDSTIQIGRAKLKCNRTAGWETRLAGGAAFAQTSSTVVMPFASTRLACTLLERIAVAVAHAEPVLLVGETGTGKTSVIQRLAHLCGRRLRVINLNQQSDSVDLLGGFKPVDMRALLRPLREKFEFHFTRTFRMENNLSFLGHINEHFSAGRWGELLALMRHPARLAFSKPDLASASEWSSLLTELEQLQGRLEAASKTSRPSLGFAFIEGVLVRALQEGDWVLLDEINLAPAEMLDCLSGVLDSSHGSLTLVDRGDKEPLKRHPDFHLFAAMNPSTDVGKRDLPVGLRNRFTELYVPELNPGLDETQIDPVRAIDREDLAVLTRSYLIAINPSPTTVTVIVRLYAALRQAASEGLVDGVGQRPHFSLRTLCRALLEAGRGYHGSTVRSLYEGFLFSFGSQISRSSRPVLEMLIKRYLSLVYESSGHNTGLATLERLLISPLPVPSCPTIAGKVLSLDKNQSSHLNVEGYWIPRGTREPRQPPPTALVDDGYILTPSVRANLKDLARVVAAGGSLPVLLQGETSVGKTSLITYLASRVGQVCYRINNHEHTDQQAYLGTYTVASATAQTIDQEQGGGCSTPLVFHEGPLVQAMRMGYWIILDELNLAPTEILEALNRVLDDNRSLFIPETQEVVEAHPQFRLFATQNPPGTYAGRKLLSRALRNRFIELHFDPIPRSELEVILEKRCSFPPSRAHRVVEVMHRLQLARCHSNVFRGKDSFITLRDLFRWAERYRHATCDVEDPENPEKRSTLFDWDAYLAEQGFLLLAGRLRNPDEVKVVADAIEAVFKRPISESKLFDFTEDTSAVSSEFLRFLKSPNGPGIPGFEHIVWTRDMRRMLVMMGNALKYHEPVLLVGDTSCGKTTVCQLFAALKNQQLHCVNCHLYTEASDFLGGLRPIRSSLDDSDRPSDGGRLFEWVDGPLVTAMLRGEMFLLDEISLSDDAVLERLNSLLEPERRLNLAERSEGFGTMDSNELTAHPNFRLMATMNPGGDYGKKELSPALRNRFTEIWCPSVFTLPPPTHLQSTSLDMPPQSLTDVRLIVEHNLRLRLPFLCTSDSLCKELATVMVDFVFLYFCAQRGSQRFAGARSRIQPTIRDLIVWIQFMQSVCMGDTSTTVYGNEAALSGKLDVTSACFHGAALLYLDATDTPTSSSITETYSENNISTDAARFLVERLKQIATDRGLSVTAVQDATRYTCGNIISSCDGSSELFHLSPDKTFFGADPFFISTALHVESMGYTGPGCFSFSAPTPATNLRRLLRALQVPQRAVLLEGTPGVGKTTLVLALARACGHKVVRINLSEATEASDLLGCDLPVEGANIGTFAWRDGPLLQALRQGYWILLDEMNLASQSVLECLNACLDHRGEVYVPELGSTFKLDHKKTRIFACQNPASDGGGRKALPKSFLNRFTQVYLRPLSSGDQQFILMQLYPALPAKTVEVMVKFNEMLHHSVNVAREFAARDGPWEFNLRDLMRWSELLVKGQAFEGLNPGLYVHLVYADRMRTTHDKRKVADLWNQVCQSMDATSFVYYKPLGRVHISANVVTVGISTYARRDNVNWPDTSKLPNLLFLEQQRGALESLLKVLEMGWMAILVGPPNTGKRTLVNLCSVVVGQHLASMSLSPVADTVELLGAFEQRESGGMFTWTDSPLVTGIRHGHWVVIRNTHLCSASVLDRLNSLLEPGGELILSERGLDSTGNLVRLKPHPDFRLILLVDESFGVSGSVSRAMRNRGIEIALAHEITNHEPDLYHLLASSGAPAPVVQAIVKYHKLFVQLCTGQFDSELYFASESVIHPMNSNAICLKRPSASTILSSGLLIMQLLNDPHFGTLGVHDLNSTKRTTFDSNNPLSRWRWILETTFHFIYLFNQCNESAHKFLIDTIDNFVDTAVLGDRELCDSFRHLLHVPPDHAVHHTISEAFHCVQPDYYRQRYAAIFCSSLTNQQFSSLPRWLSQRMLLEQANIEDLISLPSRFTELSLFLKSDLPVTIKVNFPLNTPTWPEWPDLRWNPGWRRLGSSFTERVPDWNRRWCLLIAHELIQFLSSKVTRDSSGKPTRQHLRSATVLEVATLVNEHGLPSSVLDAYPGLADVLAKLSASLQLLLDSPPVDSSVTSWLPFCRSVGRYWCWFTQFALKPIGDATEWPEHFAYHMDRAFHDCTALPRFPPLDSVRAHLHLPSPRDCAAMQLEPSPFSINLRSLGEKIEQVMQVLRFDVGRTHDHLDDMDLENDGEGSYDAELRLLLGDESSASIDNVSRLSSNVNLWPLVLIVVSRAHDSVASIEYSADTLRLSIRAFLLGLMYPGVLSALSVAQPRHTLHLSQVRGSRQTNDAIGHHVESLCGQLDLFRTARLISWITQERLTQPNILGEWRSFGQAVFALSTPVLSCYGRMLLLPDHTMSGWRCSQRAFELAYHSLFSYALQFGPITQLSKTSDLSSRLNVELCQLGHRIRPILTAVYAVLSTISQGQPCKNPTTLPDTIDEHLLAWVDSTLRPTLLDCFNTLRHHAEWLKLLQITDTFLCCLRLLVHNPCMATVAITWVVFGCLHLNIVCPTCPLDPYMVKRIELETVSAEIQRIDAEIEMRRNLRRLCFGEPGGALPDYQAGAVEYSALLIRGLAEAGLEHPWIASSLTYREELSSQLSNLSDYSQDTENPILRLRGKSNAQYSQLRRRLSCFLVAFTEKCLLPKLSASDSLGRLNINSVHRWIEAASDLAQWLTEPELINPFADIVEPFLTGMMHVLRGLRIWAHSVVPIENDNKASSSSFVTDLVVLLSTGLLFHPQSAERPITSSCPTAPIHLASQLTQPLVRNTLMQLYLSSSQTPGSIPVQHHPEPFQIEFRLYSLILDLLWLHHIEATTTAPSPVITSQFIGRLLAFIHRPLAVRWRKAEIERQKAAADRAALFIEATNRKQRLQDELQMPQKRRKREANSSEDLFDPDLVDEIEWRQRFPEAPILSAVAHMSADSSSFGLSKDDQIQKTVHEISTVDEWLQRSLKQTTKTWIPEDRDLVYYVQRVVGLLLHNPGHTLSSHEHSSGWRWHTLLSGYSLAGWILSHDNRSMDPYTDFQSLPVHTATMAYLAQHDLRGQPCLPTTSPQHTATLDVYRDPIPMEAATKLQCVMNHLEARVRQLLREWPGQPSLVQLLVLLRRLNTFSVADPLVKFLTGLQMVWQEIFEWEKNAAKHVSLIEQSKEVHDLLVEWRKMELKCWLSSMDAVQTEFSDRACTIWFHLHDVFLRAKATPFDATKDAEAYCGALVQLLENGPLGEFVPRWRLIFALHRALYIWPGFDNHYRTALRRIVGNVVWFYAQFVPHVEHEISSHRNTIAKQLKGIVSIVKWGEYSHFWSVKTNVDRCKKSVHKQVRSWEAFLRKPVRPMFEASIRVSHGLPDSILLETLPLPNTTILSSQNWSVLQVSHWLSARCKSSPEPPLYLRRLPTLINRFHRHLHRLSVNVPVIQWSQDLLSCVQTWVSLISELQSATQRLESTCPPSHVLAHLNATRAGRRTTPFSVDAEALQIAQKWWSEFTSLQQRKRLALSHWFRMASHKSHNIRDKSAPTDELDLVDDNSSGSEDDVNIHESVLPDTHSLPPLGLSYRRGQHGEPGRMIPLLIQFTGVHADSQSHTAPTLAACEQSSTPSTTDDQSVLDQISSDVSQRLARIVALRASLPRTPGPVDATPETIASVLNELGGPNNVARLIGLIDDLLRQFIQILRNGDQIRSLVHHFSTVARAYKSSVGECRESDNGTNTCDPVCLSPCMDEAKLRQIRCSIHSVGQLVQEASHQWIAFWSTCCAQHRHASISPSDLKEVFGSEAWSLLMKHENASPCDPDRLCPLMEEHLDVLASAAKRLIQSVDTTLSMTCWVITPRFCQAFEELQTNATGFLQTLNNVTRVCASNGFRSSLLSTTRLIVHRVEMELQSISNYISETSISSICPGLLGVSHIQSLEYLSNNATKAILRALEVLYRADQPDASYLGQIDLLNHFGSELSRACDLISEHTCKQLKQIRIEVVHSATVEFTSRIQLARALYPLIDALNTSIRFRAEQFWRILSVWCRLGELVLRVVGRLLTDGFCRPAGLRHSETAEGGSTPATDDGDAKCNEAASGGGTSLTSTGVDTTGAKDVSKEIECQEQIEGLMGDQNNTLEDLLDRSHLEASEGIEMPDDNFADGDLSAAEAVDAEGDKSADEHPEDELEDRMGETSGVTDEISTDMWASDSEDGVENEGTEDSSAQLDARTDGVKDQGRSNRGQSLKSGVSDPHPKSDDDDNPDDDMVPRENSDEASSEATAKTARPKLLNNFKQTTTVAGDAANEASGDGDQGPFDDKPVEANDSENDGDQNSLLDESMLANLESKRLEEESAMAKSDVPTEFHDLPMDASETDEGPEFESRDAEHGSDGEIEEPMDTSVANEHTTGLPEELEEMGKADADQQMQSFQYQPGAGDLANADAAAFPNAFENEYHGQGPSDPRVATGAGAATNSLDSVSDAGSVQPIGESQRGGEKLTGPSGQRDPVEHTSSQSTSRRHGPRPTSDGRSQDVSSIGSAVRGEVLESVDSKEELVDHDEEFDSSTCGLYQHLPPDKSDTADDSSLVHVVDSATEAQRNQQVSVPPEDHPADVMMLESDHEDLTAGTDAVPTEIVKNPPSLSTCRKTSKYVDQTASHNEHDLMTTDPDVELVPTLGAQRPPESLICTQREHSSYFDPLAIPASLEPLPVDYAGIHLLSDDFTKATIEWSACVHRSANLAHQLCESLRLVLEPTKAARMRGDYRTGKRINMRKIIPYLASHFRKDKIWLRRSQPSQREYRILIAVDDSSSMSDNLCRQMTFDALATVTTAFALLEVGRIGVCSFGESVRVLHDLKDAWTGETGPSVVSRFTFQQSRTSLVQLIHSALTMMQECQFHKSTGGTPSQLLLILSDGVFSEDPQDPNVQAAIRLARDSNLFPVCLILDDVRKKHSIFDLRRYTSEGKLLPYMDTFPLPFYLVLRDATALPLLLSDALRQWFELEASYTR